MGHEHVLWLKLKSQIAKKRNELNLQHWQHVHHQVRTTAAAQVCFVFASRTDLVVGAFHHTAGAQNLGLGPCCLFVLQVLLSDL